MKGPNASPAENHSCLCNADAWRRVDRRRGGHPWGGAPTSFLDLAKVRFRAGMGPPKRRGDGPPQVYFVCISSASAHVSFDGFLFGLIPLPQPFPQMSAIILSSEQTAPDASDTLSSSAFWLFPHKSSDPWPYLLCRCLQTCRRRYQACFPLFPGSFA